MKVLNALALVGVALATLTCIGTETKPALAGCNPFGCSQSSVAECNPFGCPRAPMGGECSPFGCPQSPQPQPQQPQQTTVVVPVPQPGYYPGYPPPVYYPQQPQQPQGQVPVGNGYNLVGGIWFGSNGQPVPADRRSNEDQASCIDRISIATLEAYSRSETHGDYRYHRPSGWTVADMESAGLQNNGGIFEEKWRGSVPVVRLRIMNTQEATIRCR